MEIKKLNEGSSEIVGEKFYWVRKGYELKKTDLTATTVNHSANSDFKEWIYEKDKTKPINDNTGQIIEGKPDNSATVINAYVIDKVRFQKVDFFANELSADELSTAEFKIFVEDANGQEFSLQDGSVVKLKEVPNSLRKLSLGSTFKYDLLNDGSYYLYEVNAPKGYYKIPTPFFNFTIKDGVANSFAGQGSVLV